MTTPQVPPPPPRPADAHKGTFGTVIVVGGSPTMIGAPALTATAALRGGAGLVKIMSHPAVVQLSLIIEPGATGLFYPSANHPWSLREFVEKQRETVVFAVGPGMGVSDDAQDVVRQILELERPVVLDADGLNNLAALGSEVGPVTAPLVLTPHPGEFRRLAATCGIDLDPTDGKQRPAAAAALAERYNAVVVLKGQSSVVGDGKRNYVNATGNPALATAGSGDVLTGLIASFVAQGMTAWDAAVLGVYLHGLAADLWTKHHGPSGLTARDLAGLIPDALQVQRKANGG